MAEGEQTSPAVGKARPGAMEEFAKKGYSSMEQDALATESSSLAGYQA